MLPGFQVSTRVGVKIRALTRAYVWTLVFASLALFCQGQSTQSTVPRPPASLTQSPPAGVAHPPDAAKQQPANADDQPNTTFKVNVKLVNVFATVTDSGGAPVSALKQDDFQIFEDGDPQQIAVFHRESELPLSIVVAIDTSLSTRGDQKLEVESARRFAHAILRPIDGLSLFQFSEIVDQLTPFTADMRVIDRAINHVHSGAATALYDT
ncbi:MAG: VWA domain-containing protein, partial [Candidatus Korobacteraceae bacterium]